MISWSHDFDPSERDPLVTPKSSSSNAFSDWYPAFTGFRAGMTVAAVVLRLQSARGLFFLFGLSRLILHVLRRDLLQLILDVLLRDLLLVVFWFSLSCFTHLSSCPAIIL